MAIATMYPPCPDCQHPTQLLRDTEETARGVPRTWWCPTCTTHLRRQNDGTWDLLDLTAEGQLIRRAEPWGGMHWVRTLQALLADDRLHGSARLIGAALLAHTDHAGAVRTSLREIGQWAGCSRQVAWRGVRELRTTGWLARDGHPLTGGLYRLQAAAPACKQ